MSGEWNACDTRSRRERRPGSAAATASTAASSPEITTEAGPFTAASDTPAPSSGATSSSVAAIAVIAPPAGSAPISRPRAATSAAASPRDSTPATCAAAISPTEWPATNSGVIPRDSSSRNRAVPTANNAGWAYAVFSRACSSSPHIT
jgi:hypothetical protein